jgi:hypothetical protein
MIGFDGRDRRPPSRPPKVVADPVPDRLAQVRLERAFVLDVDRVQPPECLEQ